MTDHRHRRYGHDERAISISANTCGMWRSASLMSMTDDAISASSVNNNTILLIFIVIILLIIVIK